MFNYNNDTSAIDNELSSVCEWYILIEMIKTRIFGIDTNLESIMIFYYNKDVYSSSIVSFIIENIFNNNLKSFKKLLKYCVKDIKFNNNIKKLKDIYKVNNWEEYGISFYIINRLSYVIYHDLLCINIQKNDNQLLFPLLKKFFKFIYNCSIYCHCHPHCGVDRDEKKLKEYEGLQQCNCQWHQLFLVVFYFCYKAVTNSGSPSPSPSPCHLLTHNVQPFEKHTINKHIYNILIYI